MSSVVEQARAWFIEQAEATEPPLLVSTIIGQYILRYGAIYNQNDKVDCHRFTLVGEYGTMRLFSLTYNYSEILVTILDTLTLWEQPRLIWLPITEDKKKETNLGGIILLDSRTGVKRALDCVHPQYNLEFVLDKLIPVIEPTHYILLKDLPVIRD